MSHVPQRKEKDCLNCGAIVQGKYCHVCGQENVVPKETFWHMVTHFFYDITHFDSSFFTTVKDLLFKPGFLSKEYMKGRRVSYLHPIKMYVFTSAIFFLFFFSLLQPQVFKSTINDPLSAKERSASLKIKENELKKNPSDTILLSQVALLKDTGRIVTEGDWAAMSHDDFINIGNRKYRTREEYDSVQNSLPKAKRDGWIAKRFITRLIDINVKYRGNPDGALKKFGDNILHKLPYLLFVSLPLFALLLKLLYIRRRQFYYADHGIFTIHLYIFTFIILLLVFSLDKLGGSLRWGFIDAVIIPVLMLSLFFYLLIAMKKFYSQGWGKTFAKFLMLAIFSLIMMFILLLFFMLFTAFTL